MLIRNSKPSDYQLVAPLILAAMDDLGGLLVNSENNNDALLLFEYLFQEKLNQYSYQFTLVYDEDGKVKGSVTGYDGAFLENYRNNVLNYIEQKYNVTNLNLDNESNPNEFYIDTLSVNPNFQGSGIGMKLIEAITEKAKNENHKKIGLLVAEKNPNAKKLYLRLGFKLIGSKNLGGFLYDHLQKNI